MATLTKSRPVPPDDGLISLSSSIPAPFSSADRAHILRSSHSDGLPRLITPTRAAYEDARPAEEAQISEEALLGDASLTATQDQDVLPSITRVQASVLTTLSDVLSPFFSPFPKHSTILHSGLTHPSSSSRAVPSASSSPTAALRHLVTNLRHVASLNPEMIQVASSDNDTDLLRELSRHVDVLTPSLRARDAQLVHALALLLADLNRLSVLGVSLPSSSSVVAPYNHDAPIPYTGNLDTLARQLVEFQSQRHDQSDPEESLPPVVAVEKALLWVRIDENLETVLDLSRRREEDLPRLSLSDPPQYDLLDHDTELPPHYDLEQESFGSDTKTLASFSGSISTDEKMRLDLDEVTTAIDRLYRVAPQLHNQRVELKRSKVEELEIARTAQASPASAGKQKERELERIVDMIGRASERKLVQQTVTLGDMDARIERVRQRDFQRRQEFVDKLAEHSGSRRIHAQDAAFSSVRYKDPNALLTLPEFIREAVPPALQPPPDPNALLTLDEAAREHPPQPATPGPLPLQRTKSSMGQRNRSMSAPALSWLLPASSKSIRAENVTGSIRGRSSRRSSSAGNDTPLGLQVSYVAEHHEGLRHVLAFINVSGVTPGANLEASVAGSSDGVESTLVLRSGSVESPALALPARTQPGPQDVRVQGLHYEIKIATQDLQSPRTEPVPLLDAEQLRARAPTTFICASCSLPLVHGTRITRYDDLPSEHWAELVDAWMCHTDQALNAQVARHAKGFWPQSGQALVGGSYILFDKSAAVTANLRPMEKHKEGEDWRSVRCMCGASSGRCQDYVTESGEATVVYRLVKYAIRPVSPNAEPSRIPLSAFIVEDMAALARAHATYRFVIMDEEERPRILMWLFKPNMHLSYKANRSYLLPERGTILAAKVLYKVLEPSMWTMDLGSLLDRYPGFPQAEQLMYSRNTCMQIELLLRESNACYPEGMRSMTRLDVGWLLRA
ncbi:HECT-like ubiquitin-conjugating enzyme-binding-domain-containing protein [Russula dissimulans]|nr:HECT-like ubiquitin-conjugating enzyme-binding-domain-containing protein [Russula dissimulans]